VTAEDIQWAVADYFGVTHMDMLSDRRPSEVVIPRHVAMWLVRRLTTLSLPVIARAFRRGDHTTVMHACSKIEHMLLSDHDLRADIDALIFQLKG